MSAAYVLHVAANDLRRRRRDPAALLLWIAVPLAIAGLLRLAFGGQGGAPRALVLVVDEDRSVASRLLLGALAGGGPLPLDAEEVARADGRARIERGDATALLVVPEGFGAALVREEPTTLALVTDPAQTVLPRIVEEVLGVLVDATFYAHRLVGEPVARIADAAAGDAPPSEDEVAAIAVAVHGAIERAAPLLLPPAARVVEAGPDDAAAGDAEPAGELGAALFASLLVFTLVFLAQGLGEDAWVEARLGTLRRQLAGPGTALALAAGKLVAAVVVMALVTAVALAVGRLAFDLPLARPVLALAWCAATGAVLYALLLAVQVHASSQRGAGMLAVVVVLPLLMLGGSFFPFEAMPDALAAVGRRTPNGWALVQLRAIQGGAADPAELAAGLAAGAALALGCLLLSARRLRRLATR